jgi:phosphatidylglycerophosphate synthase
MVIILLARDISNSILRSLGATKNIIIVSRKSGKIKAIFQSIGIFIILVLLILSEFFIIPLVIISYFVMLIVTIVTAWSGIDYIKGNKNLLKEFANIS